MCLPTLVVGAVILISVTGCARLTTVLRKADLNDGKSLVTDAKQRVVTNVTIPPSATSGTLGRIEPGRVICAEPSPDVAQAISDSFSAALTVAIQQAAARGEGSLQLAHALSESIVELGQRLGTIQLLRDKFYRACEAYANGAISSTSYTLLLSRLDRTMTTMMLAEMAAGALTRGSAAAGGTASSSTAPKTEDVEKTAKALGDAKSDAATKQKARDDAKAKLEEAQKTAQSDPTDGNKKAVTTRQGELVGTQNELNAALATVQGLEMQLRERIASAAASATPTPGTGAAQLAPNEVVAKLVQIHQQYVDVDDFSTVLDACITSMDSVRAPDPTTLTELTQTRNDLASAKKSLDDLVVQKATPAATAAARTQLLTARAAAAAAVAKSDLSLFGAACYSQVLENLQDILSDGRSAQRFKVGVPRDVAQFEACRVALTSSDENVRAAGIRCMSDLERDRRKNNSTSPVVEKKAESVVEKRSP